SDPDGDTLTVVSCDVISGTTRGTVSKIGDSCRYDPAGQFESLPGGGSDGDSFTYTISDGELTDTATVTMSILGINDAPVAVADPGYTTPKGTQLVVSPAEGVLANDSDVDSGFVMQLMSAASNGSLWSVFADGSFKYTPTAGFTGQDSFTYRANDFNLTSEVVTATITVTEPADTTPPVVTAPADVGAEATGPLTSVDIGTGSANDLVDGPLPATPDDTGPFPVGATTVTWSATDGAGNTGTATQTVTVTDTTAPTVTEPADVGAEATGPLTSVDIGTGSANDLVDGPLPATPDDTGPFPVGATTVTWSATDGAGNTGTATQTVTVADTTAPTVTEPADVTVVATGEFTDVDIGTGSANDLVDGPLPATPDDTGPFPVGATTVTWSATDTAGNTGTATQTVTVTADNVDTVHVGDLDATTQKLQRWWRAIVTISAEDASGAPVPDATVAVTWSGGYSGTASCITGAGGQCSLTSGIMRRRDASVTLTIDDVGHATLTYQSSDNRDPDGDSDGTSITILKP
ncbi:MAG: Ig-like domain-containing protein, partial [Alphaproteobacteria bacterium]